MSKRQRRVTTLLRDAMTTALDARLLTLFTAVMLAITAVAAFPVWRLLGNLLDRSPRAQALAERFDGLVFEDLGMAFARSAAPLSGAALAATLLAALSWPFLAGMAVSAARAQRPRTFVSWLEGGLAYYTRMLRIGLVSIVPLAVVAGIVTVVYWAARRYAHGVVLESQATAAARGALAVSLVVFAVVQTSLELGRAAFAADDQLRSGWQAWLRGLTLMSRYPLASLGSYLGATLASYAVAFFLFVIRLRASGPSAAQLVVGFVVAQLGVAALGWGRAARLVALTALSRSHLSSGMTPADASDVIPGEAQAVRPGSMVSRQGST
jgi:hypothetical protein